VGYHGFLVGKEQVKGCLSFETELLESGIAAGAISPSVAAYVRDVLARLSKADLTKSGPNKGAPKYIHSAATPSAFTPIVGPDTPPTFDPSADDQGGFETYCSLNNCYDYGTDIVTNTFAKPGRGSGKMFSVNTCDDVAKSAERDGLQWVGTALPTTQPSVGHYVALFIWPDTNFHWLRMDSNFKWSHKPGGTPIRNVDNSGTEITDPSKCDVSPWSQFCGYLHVVPSNVTVN